RLASSLAFPLQFLPHPFASTVASTISPRFDRSLLPKPRNVVPSWSTLPSASVFPSWRWFFVRRPSLAPTSHYTT
ncbi:hypothetical protein DXG03_009098, partial [Asterophora parasitica]